VALLQTFQAYPSVPKEVDGPTHKRLTQEAITTNVGPIFMGSREIRM